jgi:hypothetical protein
VCRRDALAIRHRRASSGACTLLSRAARAPSHSIGRSTWNWMLRPGVRGCVVDSEVHTFTTFGAARVEGGKLCEL